MRPERPLVFDDVLPISAKNDKSAINHVKERLRDILDVNAEITKQKELDQANFLSKFHEEVKEKAVGSQSFHK